MVVRALAVDEVMGLAVLPQGLLLKGRQSLPRLWLPAIPGSPLVYGEHHLACTHLTGLPRRAQCWCHVLDH